MSESPKYTNGWLCRDNNEDGYVLFFYIVNPEPGVDATGMWEHNPVSKMEEWLPTKFKEFYGFLPEKGHIEFMELEI